MTKPLQKLGGKLFRGGGKEAGSSRRAKGGDHDSDVEDREDSQALLHGPYSSSDGPGGNGLGGSGGSGGGGKGGGRGWQPPEPEGP